MRGVRRCRGYGGQVRGEKKRTCKKGWWNTKSFFLFPLHKIIYFLKFGFPWFPFNAFERNFFADIGGEVDFFKFEVADELRMERDIWIDAAGNIIEWYICQRTFCAPFEENRHIWFDYKVVEEAKKFIVAKYDEE